MPKADDAAPETEAAPEPASAEPATVMETVADTTAEPAATLPIVITEHPFAGPGFDIVDERKAPLVVTAKRTDDGSMPKQISDHIVPEPLESQEGRVTIWVAETRYLMSTLTADFDGEIGEILAFLKHHL